MPGIGNESWVLVGSGGGREERGDNERINKKQGKSAGEKGYCVGFRIAIMRYVNE